jgi:hypothetical protein
MIRSSVTAVGYEDGKQAMPVSSLKAADAAAAAQP